MNELDRRASDVGLQVSSTAGHLRKIAEEMRADDLSRPMATLADRGAETLDEFGRYLQQAKGRELLADAERFGRDRPWVLATAGMALGLAGSRMLKASAARRDGEYDSGSTTDTRTTPYAGVAAGGTGTYTGASAYSAPGASNPGSYGSPVSSDAAPAAASNQGLSPASAPYSSDTTAFGSDVASKASGSVTGGFDESGTSHITKAAEAQRLTNSDGS